MFVFRRDRFDFQFDLIVTAMLYTVCIHGLGATVNVSSLCKILSCGRIYIDVQHLS